ncbi:MAG TPA: biotin/lipoyl-binding protein [Armatimonadota bacterium]
MRIETIDELADVLAQSELASLELEADSWSITLERGAVAPRLAAPEAGPAPVDHSAPVGASHTAEADAIVEAAVVGVFHEAAPQVTLGQAVRAGDLLGTIDALTIRNDVRADSDGEVLAVHVEDGQPVEYGQPLFSLSCHGGR